MNDTSRKIYEHYLSGSQRGDLYVYVKRGIAGYRSKVPQPIRGAGRDLAHLQSGEY